MACIIFMISYRYYLINVSLIINTLFVCYALKTMLPYIFMITLLISFVYII